MKYRLILFILTISTLMITISSCDGDRKCKNVVCQYGYCSDGTCICQNEYTGSDCSIRKAPNQMIVSGVEVTRFPQYIYGTTAWDDNNGRPDVYATLSKGNVVIWTSSTHTNSFYNISQVLGYPSITINTINDEYNFKLYDWDTPDADDFMGSVSFVPWQGDMNLPTTLTIDAGGNVAFKITVSYRWI